MKSNRRRGAGAAATSKAASKADGFDVANISKEARDAALAARLWERSAELVGVGV